MLAVPALTAWPVASHDETSRPRENYQTTCKTPVSCTLGIFSVGWESPRSSERTLPSPSSASAHGRNGDRSRPRVRKQGAVSTALSIETSPRNSMSLTGKCSHRPPWRGSGQTHPRQSRWAHSWSRSNTEPSSQRMLAKWRSNRWKAGEPLDFRSRLPRAKRWTGFWRRLERLNGSCSSWPEVPRQRGCCVGSREGIVWKKSKRVAVMGRNDLRLGWSTKTFARKPWQSR